MEGKTTVTEKTANQPNPVTKYWKETRGELRKVTWPTREESQRLTAIVIGVTIAFAIFLWVFDLLFSNVIQLLIEQLIGLG
ncbi:MAG: preprotein translocase subunit SecE [Anaerolineae bacterium]|jgi:preprotein translocase subunit SecE|nr:preprotein translocase subunit SecE [Anaerolineae bacterium]